MYGKISLKLSQSLCLGTHTVSGCHPWSPHKLSRPPLCIATFLCTTVLLACFGVLQPGKGFLISSTAWHIRRGEDMSTKSLIQAPRISLDFQDCSWGSLISSVLSGFSVRTLLRTRFEQHLMDTSDCGDHHFHQGVRQTGLPSFYAHK
jgi:hypothetical protein